MERYRRLSLMEREELSRRLATGQSLRATAQAMQRAPSTLSRELTRHRTTPVTYRAVAAQQRAQRWAHHPHIIPVAPEERIFPAAAHELIVLRAAFQPVIALDENRHPLSLICLAML